jgi:quercetin dioxygenase-like cupin family protein
MSETHSMAIADNVFVKMMAFPERGMTHAGHSHSFDHITLLASGSVRMIHDNGEDEYKAPHLIITPKGIRHKFFVLEPNTLLCCIHAVRNGHGVDDVARSGISPEQAWDSLTRYSLIEANEPTPNDGGSHATRATE